MVQIPQRDRPTTGKPAILKRKSQIGVAGLMRPRRKNSRNQNGEQQIETWPGHSGIQSGIFGSLKHVGTEFRREEVSSSRKMREDFTHVGGVRRKSRGFRAKNRLALPLLKNIQKIR